MSDSIPLKPMDPQPEVKSEWIEGMVWYEAEGLTMEGKGWPEECRQYERFPERAEGKVPEGPWNQSLACSGLNYTFTSDASVICARWIDYDGNWTANQVPFNNLSLYVRHEGRWRWLGIAKALEDGGTVYKLMNGPLPGGIMREYKLYLSVGRGMQKLELAAPEGRVLVPSEKRLEKPIVFYGTSIVHGGSASRPGNNFVPMIERHFDYPVINLGVSGSAKMEPEVVSLVAEQNAVVFVIDCLPNMVAEEVSQRFIPGIRILREKHPDTPIIINESITYQDAFLVTDRYDRYTSSNRAQREGYEILIKEGVTGLHYITGDELLGEENDATIDGTHPNDLGHRLMANRIIQELEPLMETVRGS